MEKRQLEVSHTVFKRALLRVPRAPLKRSSIYDVRKIIGILDPLPPLSAFGTDLQY